MILLHFLFTRDHTPVALLSSKDGVFVGVSKHTLLPPTPSFLTHLAAWRKKGIPAQVVNHEKKNGILVARTGTVFIPLSSTSFQKALESYVFHEDLRLITLASTHETQAHQLLQLGLPHASLFHFLRALQQTPVEQLDAWRVPVDK